MNQSLTCPRCRTETEYGANLCAGPNCPAVIHYGSTPNELNFFMLYVFIGVLLAITVIPALMTGTLSGNGLMWLYRHFGNPGMLGALGISACCGVWGRQRFASSRWHLVRYSW